MKLSNVILALFLSVGLVACAHKSGHNRARTPSNTEILKSNSIQRSAVTQNEKRDKGVKVTDSPVEKNKLDGPQIFANYNTAVFMIHTSDGRNRYQGSGFFINSDGLAVSNYHVFRGTHIGAERIKLANSNERYKVAEVIHSSADEDFILFRVNVSNTNYIPIAKAKPQVGEKVFALGSPQGLENTFSSGEVSQWREENKMQISALIDHGSSGGALINEYGEVVGITSGTFAAGSQANLNYAMSIDAVKPYIN